MEQAEASGSYPSTVWTEVTDAGQADRTAAILPLGKIVTAYRTPLLNHLIRKFNLQREVAEDVLQEFMLAKLLRQNLLSTASRQKGRFRNYLMNALDRFATSEYRKQNARKRRPINGFSSIDDIPEGLAAREVEDFDEDWGRQVLQHAVALMKEECAKSGDKALWGIFEERLLRPALEDCERVPGKELAERFGISEATVSKKAGSKAPELYLKCLQSVVAQYAGSDEVEAELRNLRLVLFR